MTVTVQLEWIHQYIDCSSKYEKRKERNTNKQKTKTAMDFF